MELTNNDQAIEVPPDAETVATPEGDRGPAVCEGAEVMFFGQIHEDAQPAKIVKVWNPGCVNLDNGKTSAPVFRLGTSDPMPASYFCVLASDVPPRPNLTADEQALAAAALATAEPPPAPMTAKCDITRLERALLIPEVPADADTHAVVFEPGAIQCFKATDRRTMRIVGFAGGLAAQEVQP